MWIGGERCAPPPRRAGGGRLVVYTARGRRRAGPTLPGSRRGKGSAGESPGALATPGGPARWPRRDLRERVPRTPPRGRRLSGTRGARPAAPTRPFLEVALGGVGSLRVAASPRRPLLAPSGDAGAPAGERRPGPDRLAGGSDCGALRWPRGVGRASSGVHSLPARGRGSAFRCSAPAGEHASAGGRARGAGWTAPRGKASRTPASIEQGTRAVLSGASLSLAPAPGCGIACIFKTTTELFL